MKSTVHLAFDSGSAKGRRVAVPEGGFGLGRESTNDLAIDDATLSREHCQFFFRAGKLWVSDLQSANGTEVNGKRIASVALEKGDSVVIGNTRIRILSAKQPRVDKRPKLPSTGAVVQDAPQPAAFTKFLQNLAWAALIVAWLFLAYSLCLPPPTPPPAPETIIAEPPPLDAAREEEPRVTAATDDAEPDQSTPTSESDATAAADAESLHAITLAVAKRLVAEDYSAALAMINAHRGVQHSPPTQSALEQLAAYVTGMQGLNARVIQSLGAQAGRRITLRAGSTNVQFRVVAVAGTKLRGAVVTATGEKETSVELSKLHPEDRLHWLGEPQTPEAFALSAVLKLKGGNRELAQQQARSAGLLADALQEVLTARQ
ncbi:MAG: FHA domain-containing protein [Lentisphaerae bacterium]|nr:FHA domain-containing protein [Lentisphaerota bacterium]